MLRWNTGRKLRQRFQLVACLVAVDPRFGDVADEVARRTTPYLTTDLPPDDKGRKACLMLQSVIVGCIKNRPLRLIMDTPSRDGREALRKLDAEYRPTYRGRQMALLKSIMHPKLNSAGSDAEYIDKLSVAAGGARVRADIWQGSAATDARTFSVAFRRNWHRLQESDTDYRGLRALEENLGFRRPC